MNETGIPDGYIRVTDVLKRFSDFSGIPEISRDGRSREEVIARAADRGTRVHAYCDMIANNLFVGSVDSDCEPYVESYRRWFDENVSAVSSTEGRINSPTLLLSGQIDLVCHVRGPVQNGRGCIEIDPTTPALIDLKTPQSQALTWQFQTAAYKILAVEQNPGLEALRRFVLILSRTGGRAKLVEHNDPLDQPRFLAALDLHRVFSPAEKNTLFCGKTVA